MVNILSHVIIDIVDQWFIGVAQYKKTSILHKSRFYCNAMIIYTYIKQTMIIYFTYIY